MSKNKILIAEDEEIMRITLKDVLSREGYQVTTADDGQEGLERFKQHDFDLVIADLRMPKLDGIQLLKEIKRLSPETAVIMITAYGTVETAVQAMRLGAHDYLTKPLLIEELLMMMEKVFRLRDLQRENLLLRQELKERYRLRNIIGKNNWSLDKMSHLRLPMHPRKSNKINVSLFSIHRLHGLFEGFCTVRERTKPRQKSL